MANTLTDQQHLVTTTTLDVNFIQTLLGKVVNSNDGFSRELFRDGQWKKSLRNAGDTFSAKRGDTMLTINTGIVTVTFTDKLPTRDGYHLTYNGSVRLFVSDPRTFAICYVQQNDPLQKTVDVIRAALARDVRQGRHDDMADDTQLRHIVEYRTGERQRGNRNNTRTELGFDEWTPVVEYGVAILDAQTMSAQADPKRIAEIEEEERVEKEKARLAREEAIRLAELDHKEVVQAAELRVQDALDQKQHVIDVRKQRQALDAEREKWEHDRDLADQAALRDAARDMRIANAKRRNDADEQLIDRLRAKGYSIRDIVQEYPELLPHFERRDLVNNELLNAEELQRLAAPTTSATTQVASSDESTADGPPPKHSITREPGEEHIYTISHLGVRVARYPLNEQESQWTQIPDQTVAYRIEGVTATGPLNGGGLQTGDLIYQVHERPVPDLTELAERTELAHYLDTLQEQKVPARVSYLRRGEGDGMHAGVALIPIPPARA